MNLRTRKIAVLLLVFALCLGGCAVRRPTQAHVQDEIEQVLSNSINSNAAMHTPKKSKKRKYRRATSKVKAELVPKISVDLDDQAPPEHRFNVSANEMPAHTFFMNLVKDTQYDIVVDPDVKGNISLILNQVTVPEAIKAACDAYGFQYVKTSYGYRIQTKQLVSRIYKINYLNIDRKGTSEMRITPGTITDRISGTGSSNSASSATATTASSEGSSVKTLVNTNFWVKLEATLKDIVSVEGGRRVVVNPDSGMIFVKAYPDEQKYVAQYLDKIQDAMEKQVIIEAKVLEVHLTAEYQSGIQWRLLGLNLNGTTQGTNPQGSAVPFTLENFYSLAARSGTDFGLLMQLLNQQGRVEVLSSPHIATLNNQKALIKVGDDRFFITNISSTTTGAVTSEQTQDVEFTPFFSGIALDVTPEINSDNSITLQIHPVVSSVTDDPKNFEVNNRQNNFTMAKSTVRESDSIVYAKNGQVVIIGGLMANSSDSNHTSIPGMAQTPFNEAFGRHNRVSDKIELVILLKPMIVKNGRVWDDQLHNAKNNFEKMRGHYMYTVGLGVSHH